MRYFSAANCPATPLKGTPGDSCPDHYRYLPVSIILRMLNQFCGRGCQQELRSSACCSNLARSALRIILLLLRAAFQKQKNHYP